MGRPRLGIGTYGKITRSQLGDGRWMARARYRDFDGVTRQVKAHGATGAKAEAALKDAIRERHRAAGGDDLTADSTVADLLDRWMGDVRNSDRSQSTVEYYERAVEKFIKPGLGAVTLRESTVGQIDRFLRAIPTPSGQRDARVVLRQAFALAARYDCVPHNPVTDAYRPPTSRAKPKALTVDDVQELRRRIRTWQDEQRLGPRRAHDLVEIVDVMLGTGARIGEVLALRWQDLTDLDADRVAATIAGTVVTSKGRGCYRQDRTKTDAGRRTVILPQFAVEALRRQRDRGIPSAEGLIFPTRTGAPRWPANVRTAWRKARGDDYGWVKPHSFRKTVGTMVERELGVGAASIQLGHSGTAVTERHYVERAIDAPDTRHILDRLA
ncbi:site-specific integrase [Gordonia amicalis]|uniref:tyrosine-type recombinase/integrase n=1 Tax=Gordonia amicalis TaxID=89053 RepID=UPI0029535670|nr:site-specific integrase [Gordonia amicalis]MDV7101647.1 site-specific integrase [Gordonia amicalis]